MAYLPLANILHHKLRSVLSALGIAIGICMLVTLSGLARGSLGEVADRWEAVDADLIVYPRIWGENVVSFSGIGLPDKTAETIIARCDGSVERITPVFLWTMKLGGQDQVAAGVMPEDLATLTRGGGIVAGRPFRPGRNWQAFMDEQFERKTRSMSPRDKEAYALDLTPEDLSQGGWLELVIDERLARTGGEKLIDGRTVKADRYEVGDVVELAGHCWKIVGIVAGGMTRVYLHRRTAQFLFGDGDTTRSTLLFVKLKGGGDLAAVRRRIEGVRLRAVPLGEYRNMLTARFAVLFVYVDAVNAVALVIAFLFVLVTLYTMVLQRTREIAILKSCGASAGFLLRQVLVESLMLTGVGTVAGVGLSFLAAWIIQSMLPLLTVTITWDWIALAAVAAAAGATLSALYPAWRATRVDMVEALALE